MCIGMQSSPSYPNVGPRDTSNELIKSDYELSEENKNRNASIMAARNRTPSLMPSQEDKRNSFYNTVVRPNMQNRRIQKRSLIGKASDASGGTVI